MKALGTLSSHLQNTQNIFLIAVTPIIFLWRMRSPMLPKMKPKMSRNRYGNELKIPASVKLNFKTSLMNLGAAVIRKNKPHVLPKCRTINA